MSVYLGTKGRVELRRTSGGVTFSTTISLNEILVAKKLLDLDATSVDESSRLLTGDEVQLEGFSDDDLTNPTVLAFFAAGGANTWSGFVHVDDLGAVRLYTTFAHAVSGGTTNAIALAASHSHDIYVRVTIIEF